MSRNKTNEILAVHLRVFVHLTQSCKFSSLEVLGQS